MLVICYIILKVYFSLHFELKHGYLLIIHGWGTGVLICVFPIFGVGERFRVDTDLKCNINPMFRATILSSRQHTYIHILYLNTMWLKPQKLVKSINEYFFFLTFLVHIHVCVDLIKTQWISSGRVLIDCSLSWKLRNGKRTACNHERSVRVARGDSRVRL